jgi:hypothetical protein
VILAYALILLILVALLLRRDFHGLARISYRGGWKLVVIVAGLFVLQAGLILYVPGQTMLQMGALILSQVALIWLLVVNRHVPGAKVFAVGIALNVAVMVANGGWMPVTPETYRFVHPDRAVADYSRPPASKNIVLPRSETRLWLLSDIIRITLPWRRTAISIGDVLLIGGAAQFIFQSTTPKGQKTERGSKEKEEV